MKTDNLKDYAAIKQILPNANLYQVSRVNASKTRRERV